MATPPHVDTDSTSASPEKSFPDLLDSFDRKLTSLDARLALMEVLHNEFRALRECLESTQEQVTSLAAENQTLREKVKQFTEGMREPSLDIQARDVQVKLVFSGIPERAGDTETSGREFLQHQLKLLTEAVKSITFHRGNKLEVLPADVQQLVLIPEEATEEWRPDVDQQNPEQNPEPLHIKEEEEEELCTSLKEEQLSVKEETDVTRSPSTAVPLKSDDDKEKPLLSQLQQHQVEDIDPPTSSSDIQMEAAACGATGTRRNPDLNTVQSYLDSSETEVSDEGDEEKPLLSQLQQHQVEDRDPPTSSSAVHRFISKSEPTKHKIIHGEEKLFSCELCGYKFSQKSKLSKHKRIHKVKRFVCDVCDLRFNEKASLKRHIRVHTGEKPFACDICEHRFSCKTTLNEHMMIHTGQRPFVCDICKLTFRCKAPLRRHMRVHTGEKPFACGVCERRFRCKAHLNAHIRIHTGQKPYACDVCEQRFRQKSNLNRHMGIHRGQKTFSCDVCQQIFRQKSSVNRHMKIHARNKAAVFNN